MHSIVEIDRIKLELTLARKFKSRIHLNFEEINLDFLEVILYFLQINWWNFENISVNFQPKNRMENGNFPN